MKHTGEFWLNCLSDDIREKWLNNYDPDYIAHRGLMELKEYLVIEFNYKEFIQFSFQWGRTPEGYDFWKDMSYVDENKLIQHQRNRKLIQLGLLQKQSGTL